MQSFLLQFSSSHHAQVLSFLYPYDIDENGNDVIKDYDLIKIPPLLDAEEELLKMYPNLNDIIEKCKNNCNEKKSNHYSPKLYNEEAS